MSILGASAQTTSYFSTFVDICLFLHIFESWILFSHESCAPFSTPHDRWSRPLAAAFLSNAKDIISGDIEAAHFWIRCCSLIAFPLGRRAAPRASHVEGSVETSVSIPQVGSLLADVSRVAWRQNDLAMRSDNVCKIGSEGACHSAFLCF